MTTTARAFALDATQTRSKSIPWTVWTSVIATASAVAGGVWDISWHVSIGRDTFWTAPHLLIQLCAAIGGLTAAYLIARTTFFGDEMSRAASVQVFGLRAPLGAFLCGWGALTMLTSAPFDNWWHNAYGLDVKIVSPPHLVLALGVFGVIFGGFLLTMAPLNRAEAAMARRLETVFICLIGVLMMGAQSELLEFSNRILMHSSLFYCAIVIPFPIELMIVRRISSRRWACTLAATVYTVFSLTQEWLLPMFPAAQKLGPVMQRVPYMVPLGFPLLIIAPAIVIDLLWKRIRDWNGWKQAIVLGAAFLGTFMAVQWPFADFLMTKWSGNWVFGTHYQLYMVPANSVFLRPQFYPYDKSRVEFWRGMVFALGGAMLTSRIGLAVGAFLRSVRR